MKLRKFSLSQTGYTFNTLQYICDIFNIMHFLRNGSINQNIKLLYRVNIITPANITPQKSEKIGG